jgi:hypothetical protein
MEKKKQLTLMAVLGVVVIGLIILSQFYPPEKETLQSGALGGVEKAERYKESTVKDENVGLENKAQFEFTQSAAFQNLAKDPEALKVVMSNDFQAMYNASTAMGFVCASEFLKNSEGYQKAINAFQSQGLDLNTIEAMSQDEMMGLAAVMHILSNEFNNADFVSQNDLMQFVTGASELSATEQEKLFGTASGTFGATEQEKLFGTAKGGLGALDTEALQNAALAFLNSDLAAQILKWHSQGFNITALGNANLLATPFLFGNVLNTGYTNSNLQSQNTLEGVRRANDLGGYYIQATQIAAQQLGFQNMAQQMGQFQASDVFKLLGNAFASNPNMDANTFLDAVFHSVAGELNAKLGANIINANELKAMAAANDIMKAAALNRVMESINNNGHLQNLLDNSSFKAFMSQNLESSIKSQVIGYVRF